MSAQRRPEYSTDRVWSGIVNRIQPGDGDKRHGTTGGYTNHGCRCNACRDAWNDAQRKRRMNPEYRAWNAERGRRYRARKRAERVGSPEQQENAK